MLGSKLRSSLPVIQGFQYKGSDAKFQHPIDFSLIPGLVIHTI